MWQATVTEVIFAQKRGEKYSMQNVKIKSSVPPKMNFERSPLPSKKRSMGERLTEKCKQERCAPERGKGKMKRER